MTENNLNLETLKKAAVILGLFGVGLWLSIQIGWIGWMISLGALILFGFWASVALGGLVTGIFFGGLTIWGAVFGLGNEGGGESAGWVLLVGLGSLAVLAGVGLWSKSRIPGAAVMAGGLASIGVGFPPVLPLLAGLAVTWLGVSIVRRFAEQE
ncbi:MAG: hypothetical protein C1O27_001565 [Chloroflexi bacterium]|jgi:hypothetical protein|nr:MAG: hypothetical protein C1O27_001565 [Chloroflexota bacterium]